LLENGIANYGLLLKNFIETWLEPHSQPSPQPLPVAHLRTFPPTPTLATLVCHLQLYKGSSFPFECLRARSDSMPLCAYVFGLNVSCHWP